MAAVRSASTRLLANRAFLTLCLAATSIAMLVLAILLLAIFVQGWSGLSWDFLTGLPSRKADKAGVFVALMGSLWVCAICGLLALPLEHREQELLRAASERPLLLNRARRHRGG
jgi:phosphate transport system permease protein